MNCASDPSAIASQVVRGETDVDRLREVGVRFVAEPTFELVEPAVRRPFVPSMHDVAAGLLVWWARGGDGARLWAKVMLGASNTIDLVAIEDAGDGALLLDALWRMSEGEDIEDATVDLLREFVG
jgi:hypothetical protein